MILISFWSKNVTEDKLKNSLEADWFFTRVFRVTSLFYFENFFANMKLRTSASFFVLITRCYLHLIPSIGSQKAPTEIMARANAFWAPRAARKALARRHFFLLIWWLRPTGGTRKIYFLRGARKLSDSQHIEKRMTRQDEVYMICLFER